MGAREGTTNVVGRMCANELTLYDMSGNVLEWCQDYYDDYSKSSQTNPIGSAIGDDRVLRGGSWRDVDLRCRISCRKHYYQGFRFNGLGLRLALPNL